MLSATYKHHEEAAAIALNDDAARAEEKARHDGYQYSRVSRFFGRILIGLGNIVYGEGPSYIKFRALEIIARVPYHSWESAAYTLLTLFYSQEKKAIRLSRFSAFARHAQDNETMHVIVISHIAKKECAHSFMRTTLIPVFFAFMYFWAAYVLYLVHRRWALELNALFEDHAFEQYDRFITEWQAALKEKPVESDFLTFYGRVAPTQLDFFRLVRNDELMHRNRSLDQIALSGIRL